MPSGGARARSGFPPDPDALRRDRDQVAWLRLPAAGREGKPPAFPLPDPSPRERRLWASEWARPQAIVWEQRGQELEVALFVRAVVVAEGPKATAADRGLVLRYMDDLGISLGGLARNRWLIDDVDRQPEAKSKRHQPQPSTRDRFEVIEGSG